MLTVVIYNIYFLLSPICCSPDSLNTNYKKLLLQYTNSLEYNMLIQKGQYKWAGITYSSPLLWVWGVQTGRLSYRDNGLPNGRQHKETDSKHKRTCKRTLQSPCSSHNATLITIMSTFSSRYMFWTHCVHGTAQSLDSLRVQTLSFKQSLTKGKALELNAEMPQLNRHWRAIEND